MGMEWIDYKKAYDMNPAAVNIQKGLVNSMEKW